MTETWLSAQGDEAKVVELSPSGCDIKYFQRQSRSRGCKIATIYKSNLGSNITFITSFDFTHTSFEVIIIMVIFKCYFSGELIALS